MNKKLKKFLLYFLFLVLGAGIILAICFRVQIGNWFTKIWNDITNKPQNEIVQPENKEENENVEVQLPQVHPEITEQGEN